jgi:hypothetical protein
MNYACPCCGFLTFEDELGGTFEICPVCFWEDDFVQNNDPSYEGGANGINLNEAKKNFDSFGAIKSEFIREVRKPLPTEEIK